MKEGRWEEREQEMEEGRGSKKMDEEGRMEEGGKERKG